MTVTRQSGRPLINWTQLQIDELHLTDSECLIWTKRVR